MIYINSKVNIYIITINTKIQRDKNGGIMENKGQKINERTGLILMLLGSAFLWSTGGFLIKLVDLSSFQIASIRSLITATVLLIVIKKPTFNFSMNKILGAIAYASMSLCYISATKMTTAANAIILQYTAPIYIAIFGGWLLKERASLKDWVTILFVIGGMVLFFFDDIGGGMMKGNIIAIFSGVALAFNTIFMRRQKDENPLENVFWGCILTFIVASPSTFAKVPDTKSIIGLLLLGIFQLGISYILYSKAIKKITALEATFISLVEPILSPVWVFLAIGEIPGVFSVLGGVIVLAAITVNCLTFRKVK
ncbi:MAG: putative permease, superfamily [Clostridiales bacterium]|nr:putative permease, superfamily [Clostridiales bacterium]